MELAEAWLLFPAVLLAVFLGWGNVVALARGTAIPLTLLLPVGFAAVVVVTGLTTLETSTVKFTTPVVVGGAVAGLVASPPRRFRRSLVWPLSAASIVFAVFAAPIVASGQATYAGYLTLDDTATLFALTERMLDAGRTVAGLPPSTYEAILSSLLVTGYPMGSLLPLGVGARLTGQDVAWVFQPYLALLAAMLALVLWHLLSSIIRNRGLRVLAVVIASQAALLYAYGLWTGVKELSAAMLVALAAALAHERGPARSWVPFAVAAAAIVGVLSVGGAIWIAPLALWFLFLRRRSVVVAAIAFAVLALPALAEGARFLGGGRAGPLADGSHLANLVQPLNPLQAFGIWPAGDFRFRPHQFWQSVALDLVVAALAATGLVYSIRRRNALALYAACALSGAFVYWALGSPWVGAKALATTSPAVLALAAAGCAALAGACRKTEAIVAAALIAGGVLWTNALAYTHVNLAPRPQLAEVQRIGKLFDGQGPALMTEYLPVGVRHFLRGVDAEGASELRRHLDPLRNGSTLPKLAYANLDAFAPQTLLYYRTLVLRRSPTESRPPAPYSLRWSGRFYEVWQRPQRYQPIVADLSLGGSLPAAVPACSSVRRVARAGTEVVGAERDGDVDVLPSGATAFTVRTPGLHSIWLAGSTRRTSEVYVDGRRVGTAAPQLNNEGQYIELARVSLSPGTHTFGVRFERDSLTPGSDGANYGYGPAVVSRTFPERALVRLPASQAARLCGHRLDWVESLR
jgi:hypothetical protein